MIDVKQHKLLYLMIILKSGIILGKPNACLKSNFNMAGAYILVYIHRPSILVIRVRGTFHSLFFNAVVAIGATLKISLVLCFSSNNK